MDSVSGKAKHCYNREVPLNVTFTKETTSTSTSSTPTSTMPSTTTTTSTTMALTTTTTLPSSANSRSGWPKAIIMQLVSFHLLGTAVKGI